MSLYPSGTHFGDANFWLYTSLYIGIVIGAIYAALLIFTNVWNKSGSVSSKTYNVKQSQDIPEVRRGRIEEVLVKTSGTTTVEALSELIDQEAGRKVEEIRKEFSDKYQTVVKEKNAEIEHVKKDFMEVKEKYVTVEKNYKKVNSEKKQTEAVVRSIAEGLVVVNQKGEVLMMNPSAEKLLGVDATKKTGKPILENVPDELMVSMTKNKEGSDEKIVEYTSKDENVKKIVRQSSAVIQNEEGQTVGMVKILTDVTKQRELEEMKQKFISNVTHELRTPIVTLQNAAAILNKESGSFTETQLKFLSIVLRSASQLGRLVEDILDISKIDAGKVKIKMVMSNLEKVINDACDVLETWAKAKEITIVRKLEKMPEMILDPDKVTQILNNLISNAIKFTPASGKITVASSLVPDKNVVRVSVTDTGVGISKEDIAKLFKRFEQFGDQQGITGTGLGLVISKDFIERHGGEIFVESIESKGTTFAFTLPVKKEDTNTEK